MGTYVIEVTELISDVRIDLRGLQQPQRPHQFSYTLAIVAPSIGETAKYEFIRNAEPLKLSGPQRQSLRLPLSHAGL